MRLHLLHSHRNNWRYKKQSSQLNKYIAEKCNRVNHKEWWTSATYQWKYVCPQTPKRILEIGSAIGGSAVALHYCFPQAHITCVDLRFSEAFHNNTAYFQNQLQKIELSSKVALSKMVTQPNNNKFDFIYIDGSHFEDDVLLDSLLAWRLLEVGGVLVWDDYLWIASSNFGTGYRGHGPKPAIDHFLDRHHSQLKVLSVYPNVMVQKLRDADISWRPPK